MFENFLAEIGVEDAPAFLAQISSEYTEDQIMDTLAHPDTLTEMSQIASEHYVEQANFLAQTFAETDNTDMETMLAQLNSDQLTQVAGIIENYSQALE